MQRVEPETTDRKYFTLAPNIILALCRDPYDLACWLVVKLVAGDIGECILSAEDGAALAGMSAGKWVEARQHLLDVGALTGEIRRDEGYPQATWHLRIPDLWPANVKWREQTGDGLKARLADIRERRKSLHHMKALTGKSPEPSPHEGKPSPHEGKPSPHEGKPSPHETKKNHVEEPKEEPKEETGTHTDPSPACKEIWNDACQSLRQQLPRSTYETWVRDTTLVSINADSLCTVLAPNRATQEWLHARLGPKMRKALAFATGRNADELEVQFVTGTKYFTAQEITP